MRRALLQRQLGSELPGELLAEREARPLPPSFVDTQGLKSHGRTSLGKQWPSSRTSPRTPGGSPSNVGFADFRRGVAIQPLVLD